MDLPSLLIVSEAITRAALLCNESRGAQFREDFPNKNPDWGKYNIVIKRVHRWHKCAWRSGPSLPCPMS